MNDSPKKGVNRRMDKSKKRSGFAGREYRAAELEIEALLKRNNSVMYAYRQLLKAGRLTMAYQTFCQYVRSNGFPTRRKKKKASEPELSDPTRALMDLKELDPDGPGDHFGYDPQAVYQNLAGLGIVDSGYSDFSDYFQDSEIY